jgi:hypothetical protein
MATTLVRKQLAPAATTLSTLYTVPGATTGVISSITICNRSATPTTFRIAKRLLGAAISDEMYIAYDKPIGANATDVIKSGDTFNATDVISVYAGAATLSFNLSAQELT